jgi:error-prone DNA polymerase
MSAAQPRYAELWAASNFSFLRAASHPWELVVTAKALGLDAIGVADRNTLAGVVRAWAKGREIGQRVVVGARLVFTDQTPELICYPADREAWGRLTRLLTVGQRRAIKGECHLTWDDLVEHGEGQLLLIAPPARLDAAFEDAVRRLGKAFEGRIWLAAARAFGPADLKRLHRLDALGAAAGTPMIAAGDVLYHGPERRILQDVVTCIREGTTIEAAGLRLGINAERHLKSPAEMARLFASWPAAAARTIEVAARITFDLAQLAYEYPDEPVPPGKTAIDHLTDLAWAGAAWRYPDGIPNKVRRVLGEELALIEELDYPNYFLTVHDIVRWAREQDILCQGRGSAANSVVCFCLGVTSVNPMLPKHDLLFARFISRERSEPPDIDVDFEHERRELVMQYVYERYGRERAAICATVIHYRSRMAIREVGKALGLTEDVTAALANTVWSSWGEGLPEDHIRQAGLDPEAPEILRAVTLAAQLMGFPRHLSQHVGGFVLTKRRLDETVPIGNGAMKDRTFIEWDKDDIDALRMMKVDVLALGMLSAIKKALDAMGIADMADIPPEDPAVYAMLSRADSVGVFQVESRAQMSMLPRLRPKDFYDLVIEVAIVRPGPIQGDMVHPYLRRREGREPVEFPGPAPEHGAPDELVKVLGKTLGVPLFQEQAMRLAIEAARFTPEEANGLRRAMATFKHDGAVGIYGEKFVSGMVARGYDPAFAQRCFRQIEGFGSYGFPESHAVSFAKLVWVSAWIKHHRPDVFCAALINSQPMGFYQNAQLVRDAREHGVEVRAADILASDWDCVLEEEGAAPTGDSISTVIPGAAKCNAAETRDPGDQANPVSTNRGAAPDHLGPASSLPPAASAACGMTEKGKRVEIPRDAFRPVRLGLRVIKGLQKVEADRLIAARAAGAREVGDLARAAQLSERSLELLAEADALRGVKLDRRVGLWAVKGMAGQAKAETEAPLLALMGPPSEERVALAPMPLGAHVAEDYRTTQLSLKAHPCVFFRGQLDALRAVRAADLKSMADGRRVSVGGLVLIRQRPGTAKGVVFVTLEDETGSANAVVWPDVFTANRRTVMSASFLVVHGRLQRAGEVIHVVAERFDDLSGRLVELRHRGVTKDGGSARPRLVRSRDFH